MTDLLGLLAVELGEIYTLERQLGRGSMATVVLGKERRSGRSVAIKVLHPEFALTVGPDRFQREIRFLASLAHPHILPILDYATSGSLLYYVMRFAEGGSLEQRLSASGRFQVAEAIDVTRQVASAIDHAHSRNIVHRDIKPGNILFDQGRAMVCDFGVARALVATDDVTISSSGLIVGTPAYASPEQARGSREVDGRTDVYALACVLYEMLSGEPVFTGSTPQAILARHMNDQPRSLRLVVPEVPESVERAIFAALSKRPQERPGTAGEFAALL